MFSRIENAKKITQKSAVVFSSLICGVLCSQSAEALPAVPGDYDGDGKSDLVSVSVDRSKSQTKWRVRFANGTKQVTDFTTAGDALYPGSFAGETTTNPGIVFVKDAAIPLEWYVRVSGSIVKRDFGVAGGTPVEGDFDCDGATDLAMRNNAGSQSIWSVARSSGGVDVATFGKTSDRVMGADLDGDGCSELIALRVTGGGIYWLSRKLDNTATTTVQWGLAGDIPLQPYDLNNDTIPDYIVVRQMGSRNVAFIRYSSSSSTIVDVGPKSTIPVTGNFTGQNGFAYFDRKTGSWGVINPDTSVTTIKFGAKTGVVVRPDGSVVQNGQSERLGDTSDTDDQGGAICDKQQSSRDGSGGFVNNPASSKGTMKVIFPNTYSGKIRSAKVYRSGGSLFDTLRRATPNEWGNRERYYGTKPLSQYPDNLTVQMTLSDDRRICFKVPDPQSRVD